MRCLRLVGAAMSPVLAKVGVEGSNPFARSSFQETTGRFLTASARAWCVAGLARSSRSGWAVSALCRRRWRDGRNFATTFTRAHLRWPWRL